MPSILSTSDLIEVVFTPEELNVAMQLQDKHMSIMYLQNTRVALFRQLVAMQFAKPEEDHEQFRQHAFLQGQLHILEALIQGACEPTQVPVAQEQSPQQEAFSQTFDLPKTFTTVL